jgi:hypothetical protein
MSDDGGFRDFDPNLTPWVYVSAVIEYAHGRPESFRRLVKQIRAATKRPRGHPAAVLPSAARQVADEARALVRKWNAGKRGGDVVTVEQAVEFLALMRAVSGLLPVPKLPDDPDDKAGIDKAAEATEAAIHDLAGKALTEARRTKRRSSK